MLQGQGSPHKIGQDFQPIYSCYKNMYHFVLISADRAGSQLSKMGCYISVSQKLRSPACFLCQAPALVLKISNLSMAAKSTLKPSFFVVKMSHVPC